MGKEEKELTNIFADYEFVYGSALKDCNVYCFEDSNNHELIISEKMGKFQKGETSQYLLFEYSMTDGTISKQYWDRESTEFKRITNIRNIVDNIGGVIKQCKTCGKIVKTEDMTTTDDSSCIYCDKYACKGCRRMLPMVELDENRLCSRCRAKKDKDNK